MDVREIQAVVFNILAFVLLLITLQSPLDNGTFPSQQRLFPDFHGYTFYGRDVFSLISHKRNTGETPGSFLRLALGLLPSLSSLTACGQPRITRRRQKITLINQIYLRLFGYGNIPMWAHSLFGLTLIHHLLSALSAKLYQNFAATRTLPLQIRQLAHPP